MNVLITDLLAATGHVMTQALNELPGNTNARVAEACDAGGWVELRVGVMNEAASVRLMLCNVDGQALELCRVDHLPN